MPRGRTGGAASGFGKGKLRVSNPRYHTAWWRVFETVVLIAALEPLTCVFTSSFPRASFPSRWFPRFKWMTTS